MSAGPRLRPHPEVIARQMGDRAVLIHLGTNRIYELNATGARIWELLVEGRSTSDMQSVLSEEFEVGRGEIAGEIDALLDRLRAEGLVDVDGRA